MRRIFERLTAIAALCFATTAGAQRPTLGPERDDIRHFGGDVWGVWTAPAHITSRDALDAAGAMGVVGLLAIKDSTVWVWMNTHQNTLVMRAIRPIREEWRYPLYELGSGQYILPLSAVLYTSGRLANNAGLRDAGLGCAAGHLASAGLRDVIYALISRARPRITPEPYHVGFPGTKNWDMHSFLSGHIANSMSCASFISHRFSLGPLEALPYMYSGAIGLGRMADGRHWFSDTMAGALMGFAIGRTVANRQLGRVARQSALAGNREEFPAPLFRWSISF